MRIAVFSHGLADAGGRSVGVNLVRSLPRVGPEHDFLVVVPPGAHYEVEPAANAKIVAAPALGPYRRTLWELSSAPRLARSWNADWVLALANVPLVWGAPRKAVLIHDPHLYYPVANLSHMGRRARFRKRGARAYLRTTLGLQDVVFTQTTVAAGRVKDTYAIRDPVVIPNAFSALIEDGAGASEPGAHVALPEAPFRFLTLAKYGRRKGHDVLVTMFERYGDLLRDVAGIFTVDAVGQPGARRLMERVRAAGVSDHVMNLGPVDQRTLRGLYAQVNAVVLPSLLESFSGVYVEAMALGVPIITSDRDFARVVCGEAAEYIDPEDPAAIARAIRRLADDPQQRRHLIDAGKLQAREHGSTWEDCAAAILRSFEDVHHG